MLGPQDAEVPVVERRELNLAKSLDESENARVNHSKRLVVVLNLDLMAAREISPLRLDTSAVLSCAASYTFTLTKLRTRWPRQRQYESPRKPVSD